MPGLHLDVMDGHFVPNLSYGLPVIETVRRLTRLPIETHLMITEPELWVERYIDAGTDLATFHVEATKDPAAVIEKIHARGAAAGLALNPGTPLTAIERFLPNCDTVLVMSVNPGFGGQSFEPVALDKLARWRARRGRPGVGSRRRHSPGDDCGRCRRWARMFSVGSAIFRSQDYGATISRLHQLAQSTMGTTSPRN